MKRTINIYFWSLFALFDIKAEKILNLHPKDDLFQVLRSILMLAVSKCPALFTYRLSMKYVLLNRRDKIFVIVSGVCFYFKYQQRS